MAERTHTDYAIEHAGYLATAAREMIDAVDALAMAEECREENDSQESDDAVQVAEQSVSEARRALQSAIYGFETRRDRAAAHGVAVGGRCVRVGAPCECNPEAQPGCVSWRAAGVAPSDEGQRNG